MYGKAKPERGLQGFMINGEDIHQLLDKGVQFPQLLADDILARESIASTSPDVKFAGKKKSVGKEMTTEPLQPPDATAPWFTAKTDSAKGSVIRKNISYPLSAVNPISGTPHDYAALLAELARERGAAKTLTPEQRMSNESTPSVTDANSPVRTSKTPEPVLSTNNLPYFPSAVNPISGTPHDYAALLAELARERGGVFWAVIFYPNGNA